MEQKYNKYKNKYLNIENKFKIGDEIMLLDNNISGIVIDSNKYTKFYSIRLVGMDYNINKHENDLIANPRIDVPTYFYIDGEFSFFYPEFHSYTNINAPRTEYDSRFDIYIIANINGFPSQQFLKFVNTNIFLYHYIFHHFYDILSKSKHVVVDIENKIFKFKSTPLSVSAVEFKPKSKLSASAISFDPTNLINNDDIGEIDFISQEEQAPVQLVGVPPTNSRVTDQRSVTVPVSSVDSAIQEAVLQSETEERQRKLRSIADEKILNQAASDTASQDTEEDAYKYALRESILSNYSGEILKHFSKLTFEQLENAHLQYQSSLNKPPTYKNQLAKYGTVFNPEDYDTDTEK